MKIARIKTVGFMADGLFILHNNGGGDDMYYPYARQEVIRVNGKNGADAYQMAPNSSVLLLDETAPIIWLKTTDGSADPEDT